MSREARNDSAARRRAVVSQYLREVSSWLAEGRTVDCEMRVWLPINGKDKRVVLRPGQGEVLVYNGVGVLLGAVAVA
jgi:hypothetical protein